MEKYYDVYFTGGEEYTVKKYEDRDYGTVYNVYNTTMDIDEDEDDYPLVYTAYRKEYLDAWVKNLYLGNFEYDMNI